MMYISLFIVAFTVATIIPFGSEAYFITLLSLGEYNSLLLLLVVSIGNVLGSLFNWVCGFYINYFIKKNFMEILFIKLIILNIVVIIFFITKKY